MNPLREIRESLDLNQKDCAEKLKVTQQALSAAERLPGFPEPYREKLVRSFPKSRHLILELLERRIPKITPEVLIESAEAWSESPPKPAELEEEALPWAIDCRTPVLLKELSHRARAGGMGVARLKHIPYGLLVTGQRQKPRLINPLYSGETEFVLADGTAMLMGSPYRHEIMSALIEEISQKTKTPVNFSISKTRRSFYFGYHTTLVSFRVSNKGKTTTYRSNRWEDDGGLYYEDYGVILYASLKDLGEKSALALIPEDGSQVERVILVAGNHRLATGIGTRLVSCKSVKELEENPIDYEQPGGLIFRVVIRSTDIEAITEQLKIVDRLPWQ